MVKINAGRIKLWVDVGNWYYSKIMQTITAFGVLKLIGLEWWVLFLGAAVLLPLIIVLIYFHMKFIYPQEHEYAWQKNPAVKELINKIEFNKK